MPDFVTVNGVTIEYAWHGLPPVHAPTIVFLHEGLGSIAQWKTFPSVVCSRTGFGGLVYNRRGHGKSSPLVTSRDVDFMHEEAFDVLPRLLDVFEITHPILVGHSDGASIALIYAGSGAGEAASLVLESPHVFVEEVTVNRITALRDSYRTTDLRTKLSRHHGENTDMLFDTWTDVWLRPEFRSWNIESFIAGVRCPTLVLQGRQDDYGTDRQVNAITSRLAARWEARLLDRCGHSPHLEQQAVVEDMVTHVIGDY
jgi:pimeloyl-ACP methyl ester carboxylesterase